MKKIINILLLMVVANATFAQKKPAKDWYQKKSTKKNTGVDAENAYKKLITGTTGTDIVVAVIDGGTDISHPDLIGNIWHNPGEIPFNGVDDDKNGYVDDTVGWNFIGGADGKMVEFDNLEKTRLLRSLSPEFEDADAEDFKNDSNKMARFTLYQKLKEEVTAVYESSSNQITQLSKLIKELDKMKEATGSNNPSIKQLKAYEPTSESSITSKKQILFYMRISRMSFASLYEQIQEGVKQVSAQSLYHYNVKYDPRNIVGDQYLNSGERFYGNNNVAGPDASHGTHVAGIIAAMRNNGIGMDGIANHAKIMVVRVVPNGDERDKDVANGIRYAVDNGAKIINMSFGKGYRWNKAVVDSAVQYALAKGVLLIHAAGNENSDNDIVSNYPNDSLGNNTFAANWLEIGASATNHKKLAASFSNYGLHNVDLFAPGYQIYSTIPDSGYAYFDGTSMAAPVTSGVAALVWSQYPSLTAIQVKEILMNSAVKITKKVPLPGSKTKVPFHTLSVSGGVVNAYNALQMAAKIAGQK